MGNHHSLARDRLEVRVDRWDKKFQQWVRLQVRSRQAGEGRPFGEGWEWSWSWEKAGLKGPHDFWYTRMDVFDELIDKFPEGGPAGWWAREYVRVKAAIATRGSRRQAPRGLGKAK